MTTFSTYVHGAPESRSGYLWKQSPSTLRLRKYQWRYVSVENGVLYWWNTEQMAADVGVLGCKGSVSFFTNRVEVELCEDADARFFVRPLGGKWEVGGTFTAKKEGEARTFTFDTTKSAHRAREWVDTIQAHIDYADRSKQQEGGEELDLAEADETPPFRPRKMEDQLQGPPLVDALAPEKNASRTIASGDKDTDAERQQQKEAAKKAALEKRERENAAAAAKKAHTKLVELPSDVESTVSVLCEGELGILKKGVSETRYFALFDQSLDYWSSKEEYDSLEERRGGVALADVKRLENTPTGFIINLDGDKRLELRCDKDKDVERWLKHWKEVLDPEVCIISKLDAKAPENTASKPNPQAVPSAQRKGAAALLKGVRSGEVSKIVDDMEAGKERLDTTQKREDIPRTSQFRSGDAPRASTFSMIADHDRTLKERRMSRTPPKRLLDESQSLDESFAGSRRSLRQRDGSERRRTSRTPPRAPSLSSTTGKESTLVEFCPQCDTYFEDSGLFCETCGWKRDGRKRDASPGAKKKLPSNGPLVPAHRARLREIQGLPVTRRARSVETSNREKQQNADESLGRAGVHFQVKLPSSLKSGRGIPEKPEEPVVIPGDMYEYFNKIWPRGRDYESRKVRRVLFRKFDINLNDHIGPVEVKTVIARMIKLPGMNDFSPAVNLAFQSMQGVMPLDGDIEGECLSLRCFRIFLMFLSRYMELWVHFCAMNTSWTRRATLEEFITAVPNFKTLELENYHELEAHPESIWDDIMKTSEFHMKFNEFCVFIGTYGPTRDKWETDIEPEDLLKECGDTSYRDGAKFRCIVPSFQDMRAKFPLERSEEGIAARAKVYRQFDFNNMCGKILPFEADISINNLIAVPGVHTLLPAIRLAFQFTQKNRGLDYDAVQKGLDWDAFYALLYFLQRFFELWIRFIAFDAVRDYRLSCEEFTAMILQLQLCGIVSDEVMQQIREDPVLVFREVDKDDSGYIRFREFAQFCLEKGPPQPDLSGDPMPPSIKKYFDMAAAGKFKKAVKEEPPPETHEKKKNPPVPRFKHGTPKPKEQEAAAPEKKKRPPVPRFPHPSKKADDGEGSHAVNVPFSTSAASSPSPGKKRAERSPSPARSPSPVKKQAEASPPTKQPASEGDERDEEATEEAQDAAEKDTVEKDAEKASAQKEAAEKDAAEKEAAEKEAAEKEAAEKEAASEKAAAEKAAAEKEAAEKAAADKAATEKAAAEKEAADKAATKKAAAEKKAADKREKAEKAAAEKEAAEKAATEKAAAEKEAADKVATEKAASEKEAAEKAAAEKAAAEKAAVEKETTSKSESKDVNESVASEPSDATATAPKDDENQKTPEVAAPKGSPPVPASTPQAAANPKQSMEERLAAFKAKLGGAPAKPPAAPPKAQSPEAPGSTDSVPTDSVDGPTPPPVPKQSMEERLAAFKAKLAPPGKAVGAPPPKANSDTSVTGSSIENLEKRLSQIGGRPSLKPSTTESPAQGEATVGDTVPAPNETDSSHTQGPTNTPTVSGESEEITPPPPPPPPPPSADVPATSDVTPAPKQSTEERLAAFKAKLSAPPGQATSVPPKAVPEGAPNPKQSMEERLAAFKAKMAGPPSATSSTSTGPSAADRLAALRAKQGATAAPATSLVPPPSPTTSAPSALDERMAAIKAKQAELAAKQAALSAKKDPSPEAFENLPTAASMSDISK